MMIPFLFSIIFALVKCQSYYLSPVWVTSNYFRAGNEAVILGLTGSNVKPTYTFIFSSPLPGIPNLGYGIKNYEGNDYFGQERFEIERVDLTASSFEVSVQIVGVTNIWILNVPYIAIDPEFPHHLNSFDNVPVNYSAGQLVNISSRSTVIVKTYVNVVNYTIQASGLKYNTFSQPKSNNRILLFMTSLFIFGFLEYGNPPFYPIDFEVSSEVISTSQYYMRVDLSINVQIIKLHFSQIIFDSADVQSLKRYVIIADLFDVPGTGGFIQIPQQFIDNFIIGITDFSTDQGMAVFDFNWEFTNSTGVFGVEVAASIPKADLHQQALTRQGITMFYIKTWECPGGYFLDLDTDLCTICLVENCLICEETNFCYLCDQQNNYFLNITTGQCEPCELNECLNCSTLYSCYICNQSIEYGVISSEVLINHESSLLGLCDYCNNTLNQFINQTSYMCQDCEVPSCINCSSLVTCIQCNQTNQYFLNLTDQFCYHCAQAIEGCILCQSLHVCLECNESANYGFSMIYPNICGGCNESCVCGGYTFPWYADSQSCSPVNGDGIILLWEECDDGNEENGDGCSSSSKIENHYYCVGQPSKCYVDLNISFVHMSTDKSGCNSFLLQFRISPILPEFAELPLVDAIEVRHQNFSQVDKNYYHSNGSVLIEAFYNADMTDPIFYVQQPFTQTIQLRYQPIIPAVYYSEEECEGREFAADLLKGIEIASYAILFSSLISFKIIGLELFGVLQLAFFALADHKIVNIYLSPFLGFKTFNGINVEATKETATLPQIVQQLSLFSSFINNFNVMYLILVIELFISLIMLVVSKIIASSRLNTISKYLLKQGFLTLIIFSSFNIAVSTGLHWKYAQEDDQMYGLSSACLYIGLMLCLCAGIGLQFTDEKQYGEFKDRFKKKKRYKFYITLSLISRIAIGIFIPLQQTYNEGSLLMMSLFLLYFFTLRPFSQKLHNARASIIHISSFVTLVVSSYYANTSGNESGKAHSHVPARIQLGVLLTCVIVSFGTLIYQIVIFVKKLYQKLKGKENNKIAPQEAEEVKTKERKEVTEQELYQQTTINKFVEQQ